VYMRDEINRVEQVPVTNPDGSTTYITREIPLSKEEQAERDKLDGIMKDALEEIQHLSASEYQDDDATRKVLDSWEKERKRLLGKSFSSRTSQEEKSLARRGLADSSAALNIRRQRQLDEQESERQLENERDLLSENIRSTRIGLQQNLYGLVAGQADSSTVARQQSAIQGRSLLAANTAARQASLNDYYSYQLQEAAKPTVFGQWATTALTVGGAAVGGPAGASAGNSLGNGLFGTGR
ncbi:MAG: hypothetical protein OXR68_05560, partial [Alphaproteobacteria bacterium]|nr:hypothetical protein [Alphaproteobacteria bacterium]